MATVEERYALRNASPLIAMDCSPPRSGDPEFAERLAGIATDFVCVAYSPGRSVRMDSIVAAATVKQRAGIDVIVNISTRDMNRLALQMHLLGAQALGLENVLVLSGDDFSQRDIERTKMVRDLKPTELLLSIQALNHGLDFKGLKLSAPTSFCVGASIDLGKDIDAEVKLTRRKIQAGATFIVAQAIYDPAPRLHFLDRYQTLVGEPLSTPVFWGIQMLAKDGPAFGDPPERLVDDLTKGRLASDIAAEVAAQLVNSGADALYIMPPILKGGARDYEAGRKAIAAIKTN